MEHFFSPKSGEEQKKKAFSRNGTLFFPEFKYRAALRCTPESNYWKGRKWKPYSNCWGDTVKLLGGYIPHPPPPPVSAPLLILMVTARGRVEDTRLEAKDHGHNRKSSPKNKVFKKVFQAISNSYA